MSALHLKNNDKNHTGKFPLYCRRFGGKGVYSYIYNYIIYFFIFLIYTLVTLATHQYDFYQLFYIKVIK